jgi:hypothetical protein
MIYEIENILVETVVAGDRPWCVFSFDWRQINAQKFRAFSNLKLANDPNQSLFCTVLTTLLPVL